MNFQIGDCFKLNNGRSAGRIINVRDCVVDINMINGDHPYITHNGFVPLFQYQIRDNFIKISEEEFLNEILKSK
jgi:hypothetical protein